MDEIDSLDTENKHYKKIKSDLDYRLYRMYDKIEEIESNILDARTKKEVLQANKLTGDNIYKVLIYFDKLFKLMDERERRKLITSLVESIQVFEEKQPNGQWLKSIEFKLPIIEEDMEISLDKNEHVETIVLLSKLDSKKYISVELPMDDMDLTSAESNATYKKIQNYVLDKFGG